MKHDELIKIELNATDAIAAVKDITAMASALNVYTMQGDEPLEMDAAMALAGILANALESRLREERIAEALEIENNDNKK